MEQFDSSAKSRWGKRRLLYQGLLLPCRIFAEYSSNLHKNATIDRFNRNRREEHLRRLEIAVKWLPTPPSLATTSDRYVDLPCPRTAGALRSVAILVLSATS